MLEIKNVSLSLENELNKVKILNDITLTLENKKIYVITGPNGGGKTSLAKSIIGIYKPDEGQIILDGIDITDKAIHERARLGIGYAFQQPPRYKGIKVIDLLKLAAGPNSKIDFCELLLDVGLCAKDYLNREINAGFSGGELKRVEIATILARNLKVAIFDEPEAGIDLWSFQRLTETFTTLNRKYDTTIVIISHQERILRLADQIILVAGGKISEITSQDKFMNDLEKMNSGCRCKQDCLKGGEENAKCDR